MEGAVAEMTSAGAQGAKDAATPGLPLSGESLFAKELEQLLRSWGQCGMLREEQQVRAMHVCCDILACVAGNAQQLRRKVNVVLNEEPDLLQPDVDATVVAVMKLLQRVTLNYGIAQQVGWGWSGGRVGTRYHSR